MKPQVFSSGYLVFRRHPHLQFLLMKHVNRWDLPKGHLDDGESKAQAALRELEEETGFDRRLIKTDPNFEFTQQYMVPSRKNPDRKLLKELTIYLGLLTEPCEVKLSEHPDCRWWDWSPPHSIQLETIDPLLEKVAIYFLNHPAWPDA